MKYLYIGPLYEISRKPIFVTATPLLFFWPNFRFLTSTISLISDRSFSIRLIFSIFLFLKTRAALIVLICPQDYKFHLFFELHTKTAVNITNISDLQCFGWCPWVPLLITRGHRSTLREPYFVFLWAWAMVLKRGRSVRPHAELGWFWFA